MGALDARPSVRAALSSTVALRRFPVVAITLFVVSVIARFPNGPISAVGAIAWLFAGGFLLTYSSNVAFGTAEFPGVVGFGSYLRRGLGATVLAVLATLVVGLLIGLVSIAGGPLLTFAPPVVGIWAPRVTVTLAGLLIVAVIIPLIAAYVHHDSVLDVLRIRATIAVTLANRRFLAVLIVFSWVTGLISIGASYAAGLALDSRMLEGFPSAMGVLARGQLNSNGAMLILAVVLLAAFSAIVQLVDAHLMGQYCALAYADADDAAGWSA